MRTLKIGMCGLPASDEQLIRNLMRMFAHDPMFHWALCEDKELDVLVMSASPLTDSKPRRCYRAALLLSDSPVPDEHVLTRPLQASAFRAWLIRAENALTSPGIPTPEVKAPERQVPRSRHTRKSLRFKLRTWPPSIMLRGDPVLERMVKLLSADDIAMNELAQLSGAPVTACQSFLRKLQLLGLLEISMPHMPAVAEHMQPVAAPLKVSLGARLGQARERVMRAWA